MRKFFKYVFASMVGFVIAGGVLLILFFGMLFSLVSDVEGQFNRKDKEVVVKDNSVYHLKFSNRIEERAGNNPLDGVDFGPFSEESKMSLRNLVQSIEYAGTDKNVKGIFMELNGFPGGLATLEEIRNALKEFKKSGKWVVTYSEGMSQGGYYLASVSDDVYLFPTGDIFFKGLATNIMYMKGLLDKLDIEMQAIKGPGNIYKSAVEPLTSTEMSEPNREQISKYLNSIWSHWLTGIAAERDLSPDDLNRYADELSVSNANQALKLGLVDGLKYRDEVMAELMSRMDVEDEDDIHFIKYAKYKRKKVKKSDSYDSKKVAVIFANGEINSGNSHQGVMGSKSISKAIKKARLDSNIKAIVLRVNSPGGSALASDVMWRETVLAKAEKPLIVSMGDLAASGGYFISCNADKIYANETTITGSIGVFGLMPVTSKFFKNKLGIVFHDERTNKHSTFPDGIEPLDEEEYAVVNASIIDIYEDFVGKVAKGRGMSVDQVKEVARGRVWTGTDAKEIGLVDEIGTLDDAIAYAAKQAGLSEYRVKELPELKDPFEEILENLQNDMSVKFMKQNLGESYKYVEWMQNVKGMQGVQARVPYLIDIY